MKITKTIITCDLCGKEINESETAQLTLAKGLTYDICPDCVNRILNLVDEPVNEEPKSQEPTEPKTAATPPQYEFF